MNVFLSHSSKDKTFVEKLATAITGAGFQPWLCEVDIEKNQNFVAKIEEGLRVSDIALLIWSADAAHSNWTTEEWTAVLSRQVQEQRTRLGVVLLRDYPLPELLRTKNYIRVGADEQAAIAETIDWLKHRQTAQRLSGLQAPIYLPDYRPQDFVGRVPYLERLRTTFTAGPSIFLLYGEPGSGKSLLALQFAWDSQKDLDAVIFQNCGRRGLETIVSELAVRLETQLTEQFGDGVLLLPPEKKLAAVKDWLRGRESLLVLDDVWSVDLKQLEPGPACSVLYTSRQQSFPWIPPKQTSEVEKFSEAECDAVFHSTLDPTFGADEVTAHRDVLLEFARKIELLPLAVAVGASLLRQKPATRLDRGVLRLRLDALTDGLRDVNAVFAKAIASQLGREQTLLAACAVCRQEAFWLPLAARTAGLNQDDSEDAASALVHASLLRLLDRQHFQLHALLRNQVRASLGDSGLKPLQQRQAVALTELFRDWEARWKDCRECLDETVPAMTLLWNQGERAQHTDLASGAFLVAQRTGALNTALQILDLGMRLRMGSQDEVTQYQLETIYGNLAGVLRSRGQPAEALDTLKKQEDLCLKLNYPDGLQRCYGGQAVLLRDHGQLKDAYVLFKKQEAICLTLPGEQGQNGLALSYGNQGLILKDWGRYDDAMALHKQEEAIWLQLDDQDGLQRSYGNQALILMAPAISPDLDGAMTLLKKQEKICQDNGINEDLGRCYGNQAVVLQRQGMFKNSLDLLKQQEAVYSKSGNRNGLQVNYGNQAIALQHLGRPADALDLHKKKEAICLALGNRRSLAFCYWNWGKFVRDEGDTATAIQRLSQAVALFTELNMPRERLSVHADLSALKP